MAITRIPRGTVNEVSAVAAVDQSAGITLADHRAMSASYRLKKSAPPRLDKDRACKGKRAPSATGGAAGAQSGQNVHVSVALRLLHVVASLLNEKSIDS